MQPMDLSGERFGRLVAVECVGSNKHGKRVWSCDCDCGTKAHKVSQNLLRRGSCQSCGCLRMEFLHGDGGLRRTSTLGLCMPRVAVIYPIPEILYPGKSASFNEVMRRRYQFRWERVEMEVRKIQRGEWKEPAKKQFIPVDDFGNKIIPLDLRGMMKERKRVQDTLRTPLPEIPASYNTPSSLLDRVRIVTDEEWARV